MKHRSIRELFDYWNDRRGNHLAPERADIEPGAIRRVLADTFILSCEPHRGHPFRIAGTRVCALFGRELKGKSFLDLWSVAHRKDVRTLLAIVADESVGVVASAEGTGAAGAALSLELLLLPLRHHGQSDARLLGALAPSEPALWLGTHALSDLTVGTHRYVGPAVAGEARTVVPLRPPQPPRPPRPLRPLGRLRHGFVVYDGGQA
jgi:hypothetical protein